MSMLMAAWSTGAFSGTPCLPAALAAFDMESQLIQVAGILCFSRSYTRSTMIGSLKPADRTLCVLIPVFQGN